MQRKSVLTVRHLVRGLAALALMASGVAMATDPEIMLHENDTAEKGELVASLHSNYTVRGIKATDDGTWPEQRQTNLMAEFATGLGPGWEVGIHLPIRRAGIDSESSRSGAWGASGVMLRIKHVTKLENGFFYGFNNEYDTFARRFDSAPRGLEFRGIVGRETDNYRMTLNPVLARGLGGDEESSKYEFRLDAKVVRKISESMALGMETYTRWGKLGDLHPGSRDRVFYLVGEFELPGESSLHVGIGHGDRDAPEKAVIKAVWSTAF
ncbi:hypothetical protein SAMN05660652_03345 [Propionivibrio dicarboxylicus]|uniref:MetA-pathway of phenol degradation n=1 Tax=Propionivibrio dicarboxylicus TaxID=83767 RepID=A0A1G8K8J3_9RHOO|nr:hypothetical protein SAMN05660652_03345 [Propionivibrio dicarboxylicus]